MKTLCNFYFKFEQNITPLVVRNACSLKISFVHSKPFQLFITNVLSYRLTRMAMVPSPCQNILPFSRSMGSRLIRQKLTGKTWICGQLGDISQSIGSILFHRVIVLFMVRIIPYLTFIIFTKKLVMVGRLQAVSWETSVNQLPTYFSPVSKSNSKKKCETTTTNF